MGEPSLEERVNAEWQCLHSLTNPRGWCDSWYKEQNQWWCDNCKLRPAILSLIERECERVRGETIEECAKLADRYGSSYFANHMRKLKEPPCPK